uniref:Interferon-related developmental regulator N-terminal domain-containing protein n=1 Tax=Physcomitrium patens TaxID=3218 RepID=A0A7I4A9E2_PHYPA
MGRSRLQRKVARGDEYAGDGYDSLSSLSSDVRWSDGNPNVLEETQSNNSGLEGCLDALYEKRAAKREAGLKGLIRIMSREVLSNYIADKYETLSHQILACMKKGGSSEIALAARALGLLVLTLGAGDATLRVKEQVEPYLLKVANLASSSNARISALDAVAIVTFVCNVARDTRDMMGFLWQIVCPTNDEADQKLKLQKPPEAVKFAALSGWTLLLSSLPPYLVSESLVVSCLPVLSSLLQSSDLAVRKAAGDAAATLYEASPECTEISNDSSGTSVGDVGSTEQLLTQSDPLKDVTKEQMLHEMKNLSVGSTTKWQTRKERVAYRKSFRQMLTTLEDGVPREVKVKVPKCKVLTIKTWNDTVQMNGLKRYLGDAGFNAHMQSNILLHEIFDVELEEKRVRVCDLQLNPTEKRMLFSPNSMACKARTKQLNRTRLSNQVTLLLPPLPCIL